MAEQPENLVLRIQKDIQLNSSSPLNAKDRQGAVEQ